MVLTPVEADRPGWFQRRHDRSMQSGRASGLLIGDNDTRLDSPHLQRLVRWDRCLQTWLTENEGLDPAPGRNWTFGLMGSPPLGQIIQLMSPRRRPYAPAAAVSLLRAPLAPPSIVLSLHNNHSSPSTSALCSSSIRTTASCPPRAALCSALLAILIEVHCLAIVNPNRPYKYKVRDQNHPGQNWPLEFGCAQDLRQRVQHDVRRSTK